MSTRPWLRFAPGVFALVAAAALHGASPSAGSDAAAELLLVATPPNGATQLYVARSDGSALRPLAEASDADAVWSPDGVRIAFVSTPRSATRTDVFVVGADGGGFQRLTFGAEIEISSSAPSWSPHGERLVYLRRQGASADLWEVRANGGGARPLTSDGDQKSRPTWLADGSILFARFRNGSWGSALLDPSTGAERSLGIEGGAVSYSPDGSRVAFVAPAPPVGRPGLWVMRADGTGRERLSQTLAGSDAPRWSPDGRKIAFTGVRLDHERASRFGTPSYEDVHVLDPASGDERRLTGHPGSTLVPGPSSRLRSWWPDGSRLFLQREHVGDLGLHQMNADGTCGTPFAPGGLRVAQAAWRPGAMPRPAPLRCVDVWLTGGATHSAVGRNGLLELDYTLVNVGNEPAPEVRLALTSDGQVVAAVPSQGTCSPAGSCSLGAIRPGATVRVSLRVRAPGSAAGIAVLAEASAAGDTTSWNDRVESRADVLPCTVVGTWGPDHLVGTPGRDEICGLPGPDRIEGRAGNDRLDGGAGDDTILGGPGRDEIVGRAGRDTIFARDGERDVVTCGTERDVVVADPRDVLARDCEIVVRTLACRTLGTPANDTISGTPSRDVVCGLPGHDTIRGRGGADEIDAGSGNDTIDGGPGRDLLLGGGGHDTILARDGERDTIRCGPQIDTVVADRYDVVAADCERVVRR